MKKLFIIILLVLSSFNLNATYEPKIETNFGIVVCNSFLDDSVRTAVSQEFVFTPVSLNLNNNILNFGIGILSLSETNIVSNTICPSTLSVYPILGYERYLTPAFSLSFDLGAGIEYIPNNNSIYALATTSLGMYYYLVDFFSVGGKIQVNYNRNSIKTVISMGVTYRFKGVV